MPRADSGAETITREEIEMTLTAPRRGRLAVMLLADVDTVRLLELAHDCRTEEEMRDLIRDRVARALRRLAATAPDRPQPSRDDAAARELSDQLNRVLGTDNDWAGLVREQLPVLHGSPELGERTREILEELLINALRDRGMTPVPMGTTPHIDIDALVRRPEATLRDYVRGQQVLRDYVRSQWRQGLTGCQQ
jgi:hypothetical protein